MPYILTRRGTEPVQAKAREMVKRVVKCDSELYHLHLTRIEGVEVDNLHLDAICRLIIECDGHPNYATITPLNGRYKGRKLLDCGVAAVLCEPERNGFIVQVWPRSPKYKQSTAFEVRIERNLQHYLGFKLDYSTLHDALDYINRRPGIHDKKEREMPEVELPALTEQELNVIRVLCALGGETTADSWSTFIEGAGMSFGLTSRQVQNALQRMKDQKNFIRLLGPRHYKVADLETVLSTRTDPDAESFKIVVKEGRLLEPSDNVQVKLPGQTNAPEESGESGQPTPPPANSGNDPLDLLASLEAAVRPFLTHRKAMETAEADFNTATSSEDKLTQEKASLEGRLEQVNKDLAEATSTKEAAWLELENLTRESETPASKVNEAKLIYEQAKSLFELD